MAQADSYCCQTQPGIYGSDVHSMCDDTVGGFVAMAFEYVVVAGGELNTGLMCCSRRFGLIGTPSNGWFVGDIF